MKKNQSAIPNWLCPKCSRRTPQAYTLCRSCAMDQAVGESYAAIMAFRQRFGIHPAHVHPARFERFLKQWRKKGK